MVDDRDRRQRTPPPTVLREYALLADGERGALVGPRGDIVWLCAPRWDSDAVFAGLIGGGGSYTVTPKERFVWGGFYEPGSLIWRHRWVTDHGLVECRDALTFPGRPDHVVVLRQLSAEHHNARVTVALDPYAGFGARPMSDLTRTAEGVWTARLGDLHLRWSGAAEARPGENGERLTLELTLGRGRPRDLVMELSTGPFAAPPIEPDRAWAGTEAEWRRAMPPIERDLGCREATFAYTLLRGMTSAGGGMVAAATTSLPERAEEGRNYDYRYVWIRDQCYAGQAVAAAGPHPLLADAVRFVAARLIEDGPRLSPAYTLDGGAIPDQRRLDLPGYPGGFDQLGNRVARQFQLDAFGETLLLFAAAARHDQLDADGWRAVRIAADAIRRRWQEPDAGLWELAPRRWAHSRLVCAAGLRSVGELARGGQSAEWRELADALIADTEVSCGHPTGRWQRAPDDPRVDGALLLPAIRGAIPADHPRSVATLRAYERQLTDDHFAYRFRHDDRPLEEAEGAFLLCGFVTALAELQLGDEVAAYRWFERNRAACGPAGLYSEEYDVTQRQLRGNLPQAFVHALLLECAARLAA